MPNHDERVRLGKRICSAQSHRGGAPSPPTGLGLTCTCRKPPNCEVSQRENFSGQQSITHPCTFGGRHDILSLVLVWRCRNGLAVRLVRADPWLDAERDFSWCPNYDRLGSMVEPCKLLRGYARGLTANCLSPLLLPTYPIQYLNGHIPHPRHFLVDSIQKKKKLLLYYS